MLFMEDDDELIPETEASVEITSEPLYCLCQEPWDKKNLRFMIHCDNCNDWFHGSCVGLQEHESHDIEKYHCPKCNPLVGPSINKEAGKRPIQAGTQIFITRLKEKVFPSSDEVVLKMRGQSLTLPHLIHKGFNRPILVETSDGLGIKVPPDTFTVRDVEKYVGCERMLDVIDVQRQTDIKMTMREFSDYFCSPARVTIYNLISLEFSKTNLSKLVDPPYIARKLDWVATCWPKDLDEEIAQRPEVSKYCLVSSKDSYTDFHIDFGGTSVWYHILWGEKVFYIIEPTPGNLALYSRWMASVDQFESFFADSVDNCYKCVLKKGQTLFIPTGWIHAVYTPADSLVFGGNFLHCLNMDLQLQVYETEKKLNVPAKYLYPSFEATHWFAAERFVDDLQSLNTTGNVPQSILTGGKALLSALRLWSSEKLIAGPNSVGKYRRESVPPGIHPPRIIKDLVREIRVAERRFSALKPASKAEDKVMKSTAVHKKPTKVDQQHENMEARSPLNGKGDSSSIPSKEEIKPRVENNTKLPKTKNTQKKLPSPETSTKKQVTPIKLRISIPSAGSSPSSSSVALFKSSKITEEPVQSPKYRNGVGEHRKQDQKSRPINSSSRLSASLLDGGAPDHLPKLRLSLSAREGKKVQIVDTESGADSDHLCIADSDHDNLKIDTDEDEQQLLTSVDKPSSHSKCSKKRRKTKYRKKNEQNLAIDQVLAGTLDGINELFKSSNYTERINAYTRNRSAMVKESFQDMLELGEEIETKKGKAKRNFSSSQNRRFDVIDSIEKVHQDDDFIYLPLAGGSDDEMESKKSKRHRRDDDEAWSPRIKVGHLNPREHQPTRHGARREAVEKGLEKAAAKLASLPEKSQKRKYKARKKLAKEGSEKSDPGIVTPSTSRLNVQAPLLVSKIFPSLPSKTNLATSVKALTRKPKKGLATPKQRLGKILGIHKFSKFN